MEFRFKANEWGKLSLEERIRRCRLMAEEARLISESAPSRQKGFYLTISSGWLDLAEEIESSRRSANPD